MTLSPGRAPDAAGARDLRDHPARRRVRPRRHRRPAARRRRPHPPLTPATPGADPVSLLAWLFTPIFQAMFIIMVAVYEFLYNLGVPGAIAWAIVVLTLVVRAVLIPLYRQQLVSQRRMQLLQPELKRDPAAVQGRLDEGPHSHSRS